MDEFSLIARYFAPLAREGSYGLTDDAALYAGRIVTKDLLVDGVHFRSRDGLDLAMRKAIRTNLSDILAMGAHPDAMVLGIVWPEATTEADIAALADGLGSDLTYYGLSLLGGDTTRFRGPGALTLSVTMFGTPCGLTPIRRNGAAAGQDLWVTGTIGDACLGFRALEEGRTPEGPERAYLLPEPPMAFGETVGRMATAAIDVSDGLLADAGHMARASGVRVEIETGCIPLSNASEAAIATKGETFRRTLMTWGDDYQLLFAADPKDSAEIEAASRAAGLRCTRIGTVVPGDPGVALREPGGVSSPVTGTGGFRHF